MAGARDQPREVFGPFEVYERLGVGGTSSVFRARRRRSDGSAIDVSLKRLHRHLTSDEHTVKAFVDEARLASLMDHENICRFVELGRLGEEYFIALEYIDGVPLGHVLGEAQREDRPPPIAVVLSVLDQLCAAVDYAHGRVDERTGRSLDLVHRDISPSNLLLTPDGTLKLIDMGIAKARISQVRTEAGVIKGKVGYMAPEVLAGQPADRRADIYSIGVVAWELMTAARLFPGPDTDVMVRRVPQPRVEPPSTRNPASPPQIEAVVMQALAPRKKNRWPDAGSMRTALRASASVLHEPVGKAVIAQWLGRRHAPVAAPRDSAFDAPSDAVTAVRRRSPPTLPPRPPRFPTGTGQLPLSAPAPTARRPAPTAAPPAPEPRPRRRSRLLVIVAGLSLATNLMLLGALLSSDDRPRPSRVSDRAAAATAEPPIDAAPGLAVAPPPPDAGPPDAAPPDAGPTVVDGAELERIDGRHPRSRSTTAPYTARLCIDERGRVESVELLDGPERYFGRIERYLRRWRYRPHVVDGRPVAACTVLRERLHEWDGHY